MKITLIGHNTLLIETAGARILTDPYFGPRGNPFYMRLSPPACPPEALRQVDAVLVSHNHWDHIDRRFFRLLPRQTPIFAPHLTAWETRLYGGRHVVGLRPWQSVTLGEIEIHAVPAIHLVSTIGFVLCAEGLEIYFAGDTFYAPFMKQIGNRFKLDVALIPVTTYRPPMTMNEQEAVLATRDLAPRLVIPVHLGLDMRFPFLRTGQSPQGYIRRLREAGLDTPVKLLKEGETWQSQPTPG